MLREIGLEPRLEPAEHAGVTHYNLIADLPVAADASTERGLILLTHLDTVPPGDPSDWTETGGDPFRPTVVGDRLYGLGSADAKVDMVCKAAALADLDFARLKRPVRVVGTFAEEVGLVGARTFCGSGGTRGFGYALIGEPSELVGIRAHKGYAVFEASLPLVVKPAAKPAAKGAGKRSARRARKRTAPGADGRGHASRSPSGRVAWRVRGTPAHSSTPHLGASAIDAALARLCAPNVGGVYALTGGGAVNVVASRAELSLWLDSRSEQSDPMQLDTPASVVFEEMELDPGGEPVELYDSEPLAGFYRAWKRRLSELVEIRDADFDPAHTVGNLGKIELADGVCRIRFDLRPVPGVDLRAAVEPLEEFAQIELVRYNPPLATPVDGFLARSVLRAQQAAGVEPRIYTKATCTEAGLLAESGELEAIVLGAGESIGNVHRPNEHTRVSQLEQARVLYRELISLLCMDDSQESAD